MYESFYGLRENPFKVTPDPKYLYLGENHQEALAHLLYGIKEGKGFIVITGEVGCGKTTLIHYLLGRLNGNGNTKAAFLFNPKLSANDFLCYLLKDLGIEVNGGTKGDHLYQLYRFLLRAYESNQKVILIVDEAQGLSPEVLEEIRLLSNLESSTSKLLQIMLFGQPELKKTLSQFGLRQLRQRINMYYHLHPLSERETREYVEKRLKTAGARGRLFTDGALQEIYRKSRGVPRLINILCDNALLNAYALDEKRVDRRLVREAASDLNLRCPPHRFWLWLAIVMGVVAAVVVALILRRNGLLAAPYKTVTEALQQIVNGALNGVRHLLNFVK